MRRRCRHRLPQWGQEGPMIMATSKRHSPEQIARKLATADRMLGEGKEVAVVCRELECPSRRNTGGAISSAG